MFANNPRDFGIGHPFEHRAERIFNDLKAGKLSNLETEDVIEKLYPGSGLPDFILACRAYATVNGCLVLIDETNGRFVGSSKIVRDLDWDEVNAFVWSFSHNYLSELARIDDQKSVLFVIYRLPERDYSRLPISDFNLRGQYIGQVRMPVA